MEDIKLGVRYAIIGFIVYLTWMVTSVEYINSFESKDGILQVIVGAVFAALTLIIKFHFETKIDKED